MSRSKVFVAAILTLAFAYPVAAQRMELVSIPQGTDHPVSRNYEGPDGALLQATANWISNIFGLPEMRNLPDIRRYTAAKYAFRSNREAISDRLPDTAVIAYGRASREMVAYYDDTTKTIYLPENWNGSTPAEMAALVHAMTHHLQFANRKYYDCPEERNALPYEAQERWLNLYDRSLIEDFGFEQATLMLITQCMP